VIGTIDYRTSYMREARVTLTMPLREFREHVEWLEEMARDDLATKVWRAELDRLDSPGSDDDD
jgi:hypothetical protein